MKKTVLITGATKGIGLATSQRLTKKNWQVIGLARNSIEFFPGIFYACDLGNVEHTENVLKEISEKYHIDAIINNVGVALPQPLGQIDLASLQTVYDLNVRISVQITQTFVEVMKAKKWGRVINISSRSAIRAIKDRTSYSAAKSALIACTHVWALELAAYNITVNAIAPGPIETELFRQARPVGSQAEKLALDSIPMNRFGKPEEVAAAIEFLLSEDAGFITGQTICVDGGGSL